MFNKYYIESRYPLRSEIPIKNKFNLINFSTDDFHIALYYIENNKCKIIIRRLDSNDGWGINLKLKIVSINNLNSEIISLGSSDSNCKILHFYTNIYIEPFNEISIEQCIPKIIFQTTHTKKIENIAHYNSIMTYIELNPEYEYRIFDDNDSRLFIIEHFNDDPNILRAYDMLISGAFKADLFRYCYLYINGGCYFDCKSILRKPLREIINPSDDFILCKDIGKGYYNAIMMSVPRNYFIMNLITESTNNILNFQIKYNINQPDFNNVDNILSLTGPVLLYNVLTENTLFNINKNKIIKFKHCHNNAYYHNYMKLYVEYNGECIVTKQYYNYIPNGIHYSELWKNKKILHETMNNDTLNDTSNDTLNDTSNDTSNDTLNDTSNDTLNDTSNE